MLMDKNTEVTASKNVFLSDKAISAYLLLYAIAGYFLYKDFFGVWAGNPGDILAVLLVVIMGLWALYKGFRDIREKDSFESVAYSIWSAGKIKMHYGKEVLVIGIVQIVGSLFILLVKFIIPSLFK